MTLTKRIILALLGIIGFLTSIKLTMIYVDVNFNPYALSSFCSINEFIDCDGVAKTTHSQFFGIPLAIWGLFLYFVFMFFTFVDKLQKVKFLGFLEVFKRPEAYICALGFLSFMISMVLAVLSIFEIHKVCVLCFFTYFLNLMLALVARPKGENPWSVFVISFKDFIEALKVKKYAIAFSVLVVIAVGILAYTTVSDVLAPQVKIQKELKYYSNPKSKDEYKVSGNTLGDEKATLVVYEYTDYQCPFCFVLNTMMQRAVSELSNLKVVHMNLPLDNTCNKNMGDSQLHAGSCTLAKYAIASRYQDKYWDMNNLLFDNEFHSEKEILEKAKTIAGLNLDKLKEDAHSMQVDSELQKEIQDATDFGINGTPALRINMETKVGILPYPELKEKLLKAGAKERK